MDSDPEDLEERIHCRDVEDTVRDSHAPENVTSDLVPSQPHRAMRSGRLYTIEENCPQQALDDASEGGEGGEGGVGYSLDQDGGEAGQCGRWRGGHPQDSGVDFSESGEETPTGCCTKNSREDSSPSEWVANDNDDDNDNYRKGEDRHSGHDVTSDNTQRSDLHEQPSKKHVAWRTDCDTKESACTVGPDPSAACVNVLPGGQTDRQPSPAPPLSLTSRNKGLTNPEDKPGPSRGESVLPPGLLEGKEVCLAAQRNNEIKDLSGSQTCLHDVYSAASQSTGAERREGSELRSSPSNLLIRRRPASANGVTRKEGRCAADQALSQDGFRSSSVAGFRRLSLPLDLNQLGSREKLVCSEIVSRLPNFQENRKAVFVTYREQQQVKDSDAVGDSAGVKDKARPPSSKARQKPSRRPQTAGAGRPSGVRPRTERMIHSAPPRTGSVRPWELGFTKEELQRALPRRNFFSCHNKALKDAGFEVEEENARPRRRRLLFFHHEDDPEETSQAAAPPAIHEPQATAGEGQEARDDPAIASLDNTLETAVQMLSLSERAKRRKSQLPQVDCKPLQLYLTYVAENPGEYRHMVAKSSTSGPAAALHPSSHPGDNCHTARLVSMGRIFQEKHGGPPKTDEVLRAAYSLNPRDADPFRFTKPSRDRSALVAGLPASRKQSTLPNFPRKESAVSSHSGGGGGGGGGGGEEGSKSGQRSKPGSEMVRNEAEKHVLLENLTEVERRRLKAEEWARTVNTEQLVRAKLQVLKELGHEEQELSQWWMAFRTCSYLRTRIRK